MAGNDSITRISYPAQWMELVSLLQENPQAKIYTGQPRDHHWQQNRLNWGGHIISVQQVEEFRHISRSDRYVEGGSAVGLQTFIDRTRNILPKPFISLMEERFPLPQRHGLSLGSLLDIDQGWEDIHLMLYLLDCLVEERSVSTKKRRNLRTRWIYFGQQEQLKERVIHSSLRFPLIQWPQYLIRQIRFSQGILHLLVLADTTRGYISDFRMAFLYPQKGLIRNKDWEASIMGRKDFFNAKERESIYDYLIDQGVPHDPDFLEPALASILGNFLYHFQDNGY